MQSPFLSTPPVRSLRWDLWCRSLAACAVLAGVALLGGGGCASSEGLEPHPDGGSGGAGGRSSAGSGGTTTSGTGGGAGGMHSGTGSGGSGSGGSVTSGTGGAGSGDARGDAAVSDGGAGEPPADGPGVLTYSVNIAYELFFSCGGCHLQPTPRGGFDMKILKSEAPGPDAYPTIMGTVTAAHTGCASLDATKKRVVPGKPANSLLYIKISVPRPPGGCGGHMPDGASMTPDQIAKIKLWIEQGAMP